MELHNENNLTFSQRLDELHVVLCSPLTSKPISKIKYILITFLIGFTAFLLLESSASIGSFFNTNETAYYKIYGLLLILSSFMAIAPCLILNSFYRKYTSILVLCCAFYFAGAAEEIISRNPDLFINYGDKISYKQMQKVI